MPGRPKVCWQAANGVTPKEWVDGKAFRLFCRVPGPLLGIAMGLLGLALMKLMSSGPRAFIYFDF